MMSAKSRRALLHWHNKYRSIAAKGEYKIVNENSTLGALPPATRMHQLKYNCSLEISCLKRIAQCKVKHSRPGENLLAVDGIATYEYAAEGATKTWADEIAILGISGLHLWGDGKAHASQRELCMGANVQSWRNVVRVWIRRKKGDSSQRYWAM
ncbi:SCP-like protein [Ancylostoma duodenale]|uniref:SCP-like protein n=1 Tax=Ancylostoma duodenale TaxID=51022 RepID=A0A0C2FMG5_9BILA|nr:SCP-like protein [Ancylostoma duodenale]